VGINPKNNAFKGEWRGILRENRHFWTGNPSVYAMLPGLNWDKQIGLNCRYSGLAHEINRRFPYPSNALR
jgi:hypothetical protein